MNETEIIEALKRFSEHLHFASLFSDPFRWIAWAFVSGLSWLVDGLENVTNSMLLVKNFFQNPEIVAFAETIKPILFILLAFSLLYSGYLIIFQQKIQREAIVINFIIAMSVILVLTPGMQKANEFTDEAIKVVNSGALFGSENGTVSENIIARNTSDLVEYDKNNFSNVTQKNSIPIDMISKIKITERFDPDILDLSDEGKDIAENYLNWNGSEIALTEFDQGGMADWNNEYYYRYSLDWLTIIATLGVMGFTLFSIAYKLARLSFELVFNYILVMLISPTDIHDGQKTKKVLQSILNTFLVIILIFLSMKIYIIGTSYLADNFNGLVYIIAMIGFSIALLDGPNIVERLFGIDAGLKNGWGLLAGTYATAKMASGLAKGTKSLLGKGKGKGGSEDGETADNESAGVSDLSSSRSPLNKQNAPSPFGDGSTDKDSSINSQSNTSIPLTKVDSDSDSDLSQQEQTELPSSSEGSNETSSVEQQRQSTAAQQVNVTDVLSASQQMNGNTQEQQGSLEGQVTPNVSNPVNNPNLVGGLNETSSVEQQRQSTAAQQVNVTDVLNASQQMNGNTQEQQGSLEGQVTPNVSNPVNNPNLVGGLNETSSIEQQRQSTAAQQVNVTDVLSASQQMNSNAQQQGSLEGQVAPNISSPVNSPNLVGGLNETSSIEQQRQSTATQQVNVTDVLSTSQQINSTSQQQSSLEGQIAPNISSPVNSPNLVGGLNETSSIEQQRQSTATQRVNVTDILRASQEVASTSQQNQSSSRVREVLRNQTVQPIERNNSRNNQ